MTEKEKRDKGELYDANYDKALERERIKVKDLCFKYNNLEPSKQKERKELIKEILGSTKSSIKFLINVDFPVLTGPTTPMYISPPVLLDIS